jgi:hypothetical protein
VEEISTHTDVTGSLIVLPEAFNLGREYDPNYKPKEGPRLDERCVFAFLRSTAERQQIVFVVSVIEVDTGLNSAWFVDAEAERLMCRKIMNDQSQEYAPCTCDCQRENPIRYSEETCIGALICADAIDNRPTDGEDAEVAYRRLTGLQSDLSSKRSILCVPAYMNTTQSDPATSGSGLILSNSRPGFSSFIRDREGNRLFKWDGLQNHIHLEEVCRIMAERT